MGPRGLTTRPPTDRMRESVFSSLGGAVVGAVVLDLYAGAGTMGLEALSRGARSVTFVERNRRALQALRSNIAAVGLGGEVMGSDVADALKTVAGPFDLVFVDPPYAASSPDLESVLAAAATVLADDGLLLLHRRRGPDEVPSRGTLVATGSRRYGDAQVWWYEKEEA